MQSISGQLQDEIMDLKDAEQVKKIFESYETNYGLLPKRVKVFVSLSPVKMLVKRYGEIQQAFRTGSNAYCLVFENQEGEKKFYIISTIEAYTKSEQVENSIQYLVNKYKPNDFEFSYLLYPKDILIAQLPNLVNGYKSNKVFLQVTGLTYKSSANVHKVNFSYNLSQLKFRELSPLENLENYLRSSLKNII